MRQKNKNPFFSLIIPCLNEESYLPRLMKSISSQTFRDFEVIIVDAYSTDRSIEIVQKLGKNINLKIIYSKIKNVYAQRNIGAGKAKGKYFVSLDSDVILRKDYLSCIYENVKNRQVLFLTTYVYPDDSKIVNNILTYIANISVEAAKIIGKPFAGGYNCVIENKTFRRLKGFREDLALSEDHEFATRAYLNGINLKIIRSRKLAFSFRRVNKNGVGYILVKYLIVIFHFLFIGPVTAKRMGYEMGGQVFKEDTK